MTDTQKYNCQEPAVQARELTRVFKQGNQTITALDGIDLTIHQGDFVAVMGASGSGKSTLLHLIAGLIRPTSGQVVVEGNDLGSLSDRRLTLYRRRRVGLVFQNYNLIPHLTTEENILLPLRADGASIQEGRDKRHVLWERLGLTTFLNQMPDTLSGGQQQRVAMARALSMEPAILLADEPTGNLDSVNSRKICEVFDELNRQDGRTITLVTHEPGVAIFAKRVIVLHDGRLLADWQTSQFRDAHDLAATYQELAAQTDEEQGAKLP
ncbi:MAG: ABC transporter ATP-binding protein [Planctomycetia bacterium]|nr:ABC transporter ATP-binding protein [Planctomycetia bacterium]